MLETLLLDAVPNILTFKSPSDLVEDASKWIVESDGGWQSLEAYPYITGSLPEIGFKPIKIESSLLTRVRAVSAVFTSYYDTPVGAMGYNLIRIKLDDGLNYHIGTNDAWTGSVGGQRLLQGESDVLAPERQLVDYVNKPLSFKVPANRRVVGLEVCSASYIEYPRGKFSMKDIQILLA